MNGICNITIEGVPVKLRFGMPANRFLFEFLQVKPECVTENTEGDGEPILNELGLAALLNAGYKNACIVNEEEITLKLVHFVDYVENAFVTEDTRELRKAVDCYEASTQTKKVREQVQNDTNAVKKKLKQTGKK